MPRETIFRTNLAIGVTPRNASRSDVKAKIELISAAKTNTMRGRKVLGNRLLRSLGTLDRSRRNTIGYNANGLTRVRPPTSAGKYGKLVTGRKMKNSAQKNCIEPEWRLFQFILLTDFSEIPKSGKAGKAARLTSRAHCRPLRTLQ